MEKQQAKIGQKIKRIREYKNLTQKYLADELGMTQGAYSKIEMGESDISVTRLEKIAKLFDMKLEELLTFDNVVFNTTNNPNGGNVMSQVTYTISENERRLYEKQIDTLKEELEFLKKMLEIVMNEK